MKKLLFNNTYNNGKVTHIIFENKGVFIGVCLEFDLEVFAKTGKEAEEQLDDYTKAWLENVKKNKLPEELLNKPAPLIYWKLYKRVLEEAINKFKAQQNPSLPVKVDTQNVFSRSLPYNHFAFA